MPHSDFEAEVIAALAELQTGMKAIIGNGQPGRLGNAERKIEQISNTTEPHTPPPVATVVSDHEDTVALVSALLTSLSGVSTTGAGTAFSLPSSNIAWILGDIVTWQTIYTGTPTAISVNLEGSIDGTNWFVLDTSTSTAGEMRHVVNKPVEYLRCNITSYTVNSSTATCQFRVYTN